MEEVLNVLGVVKGRAGSRRFRCLLLISGLAGIDSYKNK